jgi:hypothetical protein
LISIKPKICANALASHLDLVHAQSFHFLTHTEEQQH